MTIDEMLLAIEEGRKITKKCWNKHSFIATNDAGILIDEDNFEYPISWLAAELRESEEFSLFEEPVVLDAKSLDELVIAWANKESERGVDLNEIEGCINKYNFKIVKCPRCKTEQKHSEEG